MANGTGTSSEERLRRRFRIASFIVILGLLVLTVTADTFGRLFIDPNFHASDVAVLSLIGAVLGYAGIEALSLMQGQGPRKGPDA